MSVREEDKQLCIPSLINIESSSTIPCLPPEQPRHIPTLAELCIDKIVACGCRFMFREIHHLPDDVVDTLIKRLAEENLLTDNVALRSLTKQRISICWNGATLLRRTIFSEIPRRCPYIKEIHLQWCKQLVNRTVRDILVQCRFLKVLHLDGCRHISDSAFMSGPFEILNGLTGLTELGLSQCPQVTSTTLYTIIKNCPLLEKIDISRNRRFCNSSVSELFESCRFLKYVNVEYCSGITEDALFSSQNAFTLDTPFDSNVVDPSPAMFELSLKGLYWGGLYTSPRHLFGLSILSPHLEILDLRWCRGITDYAISLLLTYPMNNDSHHSRLQNQMKTTHYATSRLPELHTLCLRGCSEISNKSLLFLSACPKLRNVDVSWCIKLSPDAIFGALLLKPLEYLNISFCCTLGTPLSKQVASQNTNNVLHSIPYDEQKNTLTQFANHTTTSTKICHQDSVMNTSSSSSSLVQHSRHFKQHTNGTSINSYRRNLQKTISTHVENLPTQPILSNVSANDIINDNFDNYPFIDRQHTPVRAFSLMNMQEVQSYTCPRLFSLESNQQHLPNNQLFKKQRSNITSSSCLTMQTSPKLIHFTDKFDSVSGKDNIKTIKPISDPLHPIPFNIINMTSRMKMGRLGPTDREWWRFFSEGGVPSELSTADSSLNRNLKVVSDKSNFNNTLFQNTQHQLIHHQPKLLSKTFPITNYIRSPPTMNKIHKTISSTLFGLPNYNHYSCKTQHFSVSSHFLQKVSNRLTSIKLDGLSECITYEFLQDLSRCSLLHSLSFRFPCFQVIDSPSQFVLLHGVCVVGKQCSQFLRKLRVDLTNLSYLSQCVFIQQCLPIFKSLTKLALKLSDDQYSHPTNLSIDKSSIQQNILLKILTGRVQYHCQKLQVLHVFNCKVIKSLFQHDPVQHGSISDPLQPLKSLRSFIISDCLDIEDIHVEKLCQALPVVQRLYFLNCPKLTEASYLCIIKYCRAIKTIHIIGSNYRKRIDRTIL